jgi:hypothetical protein
MLQVRRSAISNIYIHKNDSAPGHRNKTKRARSDVARYSSKGELPTGDYIRGRRSGDYLVGYIKSFLNDEDFRTTLRHNCFSSIDFIELEERQSTERKVMASLEQAIETV